LRAEILYTITHNQTRNNSDTEYDNIQSNTTKTQQNKNPEKIEYQPSQHK